MKNIQVIDGADNCAYSIYQVDDNDFAQIFPAEGQDVEFIGDVVNRLGKKVAGEILSKAWSRRIEKQEAMGIHGTLFYELDAKKKFYPNKKESDLDNGPLQASIR